MIKSKLPTNARIFINLITTLTEREKRILVERFHNDQSMVDVAKKLRLTKPRIQQLENKLVKEIDKSFKPKIHESNN